jgi:hypothetical protein
MSEGQGGSGIIAVIIVGLILIGFLYILWKSNIPTDLSQR